MGKRNLVIMFGAKIDFEMLLLSHLYMEKSAEAAYIVIFVTFLDFVLKDYSFFDIHFWP